jgi:O-antigen biosynthesis protein
VERRRADARKSLDLTLKQSLQFALWHAAARVAGWLRPPAIRRVSSTAADSGAPAGISVVIPSRNGKPLLAAQLPGIARELPLPSEVIVVDNGSSDGTGPWLEAEWPLVQLEVFAEALSFAAAINRGVARARYSYVCLLNNDMLLEPGFFTALVAAFHKVPGLFCATAQIRFPAGVRREETGKAVMAQADPDDFPIRCDEPIAGEDLTWVLYGSGGCSLYDGSRLRALGGVDEAYAPAYVEDLDLGYRAWQRGWPTVFVASAVVTHLHRATTSRYYTAAELSEVLEINYLKFLTRAVASGPLFRRLWNQAIHRLRRRGDRALRRAAGLALTAGPPTEALFPEEQILALTGGDVAAFPGGDARQAPLVINADSLETPTPAVLASHCEVVLVRGGDAIALEAARYWTEKKWRKIDKGAGGTPSREPHLPSNT